MVAELSHSISEGNWIYTRWKTNSFSLGKWKTCPPRLHTFFNTKNFLCCCLSDRVLLCSVYIMRTPSIMLSNFLLDSIFCHLRRVEMLPFASLKILKVKMFLQQCRGGWMVASLLIKRKSAWRFFLNLTAGLNQIAFLLYFLRKDHSDFISLLFMASVRCICTTTY